MNANQARAYAAKVDTTIHKELVRFYNSAREFMENGSFRKGEKISMVYSSFLISKENIEILKNEGYIITTVHTVGSPDNYVINW